MHKGTAVLLLALALALLPACPAWADVALPLQPPGSSLAPGGSTRVQMAAETVLVEVLPAPDLGRVRVQADFTLRNLGEAEERLAVRFPLEEPSGMGDGYGRFPQVKGFMATVNGAPVTTRTAEEPGEYDGGEPVTWAVFDVTFPPGEAVAIAVSYETELTGYHDPTLSGYSLASVSYILETGAGWEGPIGSADIILRLPYEAGPENVRLQEWTAPGGQVAGNEVRWHYEALEPTREDNWRAYLVWPDDWQHILDLRQAVQDDPEDVGSWIALARMYRRVGSEKHGMVYDEPMAALSESAAREAVRVAPEDAAAHAELAETLWWRLMDFKALGRPMSLDDPAVQVVLWEAAAALQLEPANAQALAVQREVWERAGITPAPATATLAPTATPEPPAVTPVPTATFAPAAVEGLPTWPFLLALAVVTLVAVPVVVRGRRGNRE